MARETQVGAFPIMVETLQSYGLIRNGQLLPALRRRTLTATAGLRLQNYNAAAPPSCRPSVSGRAEPAASADIFFPADLPAPPSPPISPPGSNPLWSVAATGRQAP